MNIAVVCPYAVDRHGGVQSQAIGLVDRLRDAGRRAWLVAPGQTGPEGSRLVGRSVLVPGNRSLVPLALGPGVPGRVRRALEGADLVHVHEPLMPLTSWAALGASVPLVGTFHADPSPAVRLVYSGLAPVLRRLTGRLAATAVSPVAAAAVRPFLGQVEVIPNGFDVGVVPRVARGGRQVAFVGRDEPRKGLEVLLLAWPGVRRAVPGAELVVIGAERPGSEGVRFLGRVPDPEKMDVLASSAVFCAPNLGGESFGITLLEALASGCEVVASDLEAFRHVLGGLGRLVAPGDPEALAGALVEALRSKGDPEAARSRADLFDWSRVFPQYLEVYQQALNR